MATYANGKSAGVIVLAIVFWLSFPISTYSLTHDLTTDDAIEIWGEGSGVNSGSALAHGDINGDGYGDIVIGAPHTSPLGRDKAGAVYIILGGADFPQNAPIDLSVSRDMVIHGAASGDLLGAALAVGDVNDDGMDDMIIGAPGADTPGTNPSGAVYVIFGVQSLPLSFDLNASTADVVIAGEPRAWDYYSGIALASGDINGDNIKDIILGFRGANNAAGKVYVIFGSGSLLGTLYLPDSADMTISGAEDKDYLGDRLASGNINADPYDDIIIGAWGADRLAGKVFVIFGNNAPPSHVDLSFTPADITISGDNARDYLGSSLACGDLNGDGIDDLAVGAWAADSSWKSASGKVYVVYGTGSFASPHTIDLSANNPDIILHGPQAGDNLGYALATGDVNGDGISDLLIGAYGTDLMAGRVYGVFGKTLLASNFDMEILGENPYDQLGVALASGDLNGDDISDIICGAFKADPDARNDAGKTYVILGTLTAPTTDDATTEPTGDDTTTESTGADTTTRDRDGDSGPCFIATTADSCFIVLSSLAMKLLAGFLLVGSMVSCFLTICGGPVGRSRD